MAQTPISDLGHTETAPTLHVLVASTSCPLLGFAHGISRKLNNLNHISVRDIVDDGFKQDGITAEQYGWHSKTDLQSPSISPSHHINPLVQRQAAGLCQWADLLVFAPIDADTLSKMLQGHADNLLLELLRGWDVSKKILLVPGMSIRQWENPMTKKQLSKLRRKWNWVRVLQPILWTFEQSGIRIVANDGTSELMNVVRNQVDLMNIGQDVDYPVGRSLPNPTRSKLPSSVSLPPELWSIILDYNGDWELAQALKIYTNLPKPLEWQRHPGPETWSFSPELEREILTGTLNDVKRLLQRNPPPRWLSRLSVKLIFKFAKTQILSYLESYHKDLFWQTFGHTYLPDKASALFGKVEILEWWRTSPSFLTKEYTTEAIDGASRAGFVHVLEWWRRSGLQLRYTEAAMEQASARGNVEVLQWWKEAGAHKGEDEAQSSLLIATDFSENHPDAEASPLRLLPGKSICLAAQHDQREVLRWWLESSIPIPYLDSVCRLASAAGHVEILSTFYSLLKDKMPYDNQVLIAASKYGHVNVLQWWKDMARGKDGYGERLDGSRGLRVEYKTCDVEEALEDCVDSGREESVRRWWAGNGLNLGVETSEWMKTKVL